jgi:hypothetical protein
MHMLYLIPSRYVKVRSLTNKMWVDESEVQSHAFPACNNVTIDNTPLRLTPTVSATPSSIATRRVCPASALLPPCVTRGCRCKKAPGQARHCRHHQVISLIYSHTPLLFHLQRQAMAAGPTGQYPPTGGQCQVHKHPLCATKFRFVFCFFTRANQDLAAPRLLPAPPQERFPCVPAL